MGSVSKVYFSKEISPESIVKLYDTLGREHFSEKKNAETCILFSFQ